MGSDPIFLALPVALPLLAGALLVIVERRGASWAWPIAFGVVLVLLALAAHFVARAGSGAVDVLLVGNWRVPFGIALAVDRLSALMLVLTAIVGLAGLLYARGGDAQRGEHFHALFMLQLAGLNGAFLTADLFNLFVFFEVLLIASYGLLLHGGGAARLKASIHYVVFNLTGSALFLIAVAALYGLTGTLSMADLAVRVPQLAPDATLLIRAAALLLLVVFCVKAALLPLYFWLPDTYGAATAPVAAVFAIMTKVGVYAVARMYTLVFGDAGGFAANVAVPWLPVLAMATLALGAAGALAAAKLRTLIAYLVVASAGTLLLSLGLGTEGAVAAGLFYLIHSTLFAAAFFLLVDRVTAARGATEDVLVPAKFGVSPAALGAGFFVVGVAAAALPPSAGFFGKALLLQSAVETPFAAWVWAVVLLSSFAMIVAVARAGSIVFWKPAPATEVTRQPRKARTEKPAPGMVTVTGNPGAVPNAFVHHAAVLLLVASLGVNAFFAGPIAAYTEAAARQLFTPTEYVDAVLGAQPVAPRYRLRDVWPTPDK
ncbi:MAG TPA: monovalent cation/H+ antiporter subunit D [Burkholderiaceae bacterium]|nr:monovalent cation/H+ antiporter subunit D [Burkholderiaceae bacterium]